MKRYMMTIISSILLSGSVFATPKANTMDIVDTAIAAGQFKTLVAAVDAAGLTSALKGPGPFTVFAPTDDAFAKLPAGTVQALLNNIPELTKILTYHVVSGENTSSELLRLGSVKTLQGETLEISACGGKVYINDSEVIMANVQASNGIIHVIDTVLMPK